MSSTWPRRSPAGKCRSTNSTIPGTTRRSPQALTAIKGIGVWTAEMFLIFALNRPDVLPASDLGVRVGLRDRHGLAELPRPRDCHCPGRNLAALPHDRQLVPLEGDRHTDRAPRRLAGRRAVQSSRPNQAIAMTFDLILKGGWVIDGSGGPPFCADVALLDHDDRRGRPARRRRGRPRHRRRPGVTSSPASSTPTSTATSCSWPIRSICPRSARE